MHTSARSDAAVWDPVETGPRERLGELQLDRLRATVERTLRDQPPMADRLTEAGIAAAGEISSLDDLTRLPFSRKSDLRESYPFGLLAVPLEQVVRVHASSGSHGKPTVVGYTRADLEAWIEVMARCMTMAGVRPGMIVHNANGYGLFTGGLGFHYGGERIGATVIPVSGGFTARQAMLLRDLGGQVLCATPSYALVIAQAVRDAGLEPSDLALQIGLFGGEPWTEEMRTELDRELGIEAVSFYGLSEMCGPGVAAECLDARDGLHVQEDHFLVEAVDPETGEPVPEGADGELVFTTLLKQAQPLIRYRTGDIGSITSEPCACGRTFARITALRGRLDDMLIIRGVNLFPSTVETLLLGVAEVAPHYRLIVERPAEMDEVTVECEPADSDIDRAELALRLETLLRDHTGIRIPVSVLEPGAVPRSEGKAVRVVDRRQAS
ncbi:MAG TPA: phenylacetate--CoA ligase [Solirubrobacterales bacterium]|nr:phenylacetate--CoA ligase [Solirubrobacterales bacterium]